MLLMVIGGVLICAGLVLLFRRDAETSSETKVKYKDFEITSRKPSLILICVGTVLVAVPYAMESKSPAAAAGSPAGSPAMSPAAQFEATSAVSTACCFDGGRCPMISAEAVGAACFCADLMGNMATGTVCP
jgi:hypothetical protein